MELAGASKGEEEPDSRGRQRRVREGSSEEAAFNPGRSWVEKDCGQGEGRTQRPIEWESLRPGDPQVLLTGYWPGALAPRLWIPHTRDVLLKVTQGCALCC